MLERRVAVKILRPALGDDPDALARFRREARLAARVNHVGVVAMYDTVSGDGCDAMVQELIGGNTLRTLLDTRPRLRVREAVGIALALADALAAVHTVGIVHRDVQPANVLLADDGRVLLADFGTAALHRHPVTAEDLAAVDAAYRSPEQTEGAPTSERADLYSLGVVLYECLAGRRPFAPDAATTSGAVALAAARGDAIPLGTLRPSVGPRLARLVRTCLARQPADRPRSAAAVRDALRSILAELDDAADDDTPAAPADAAPADGSGADDHDHDDGVTSAAPDRAAPTGPTDDDRHGHHHRRWPLVAAAIVASVIGAFALNVLSGRPVGDIGQPAPDAAAAAAEASPLFTVPPATIAASTTLAPTAPAPTDAVTSAAPVTIVSVGEFDPAPGDGRENPALLGNLIDGRERTFWSSLCYDEVGLGRKEGVGLVFELSGPAAGHAIEVVSTTRGWSASAYVSDQRPSSVRGWGTPVSTRSAVATPTVTFPLVDATGRYVLVWFTRLGPSPTCQLPYDVRVSEVHLVG